MSRRFAHSTYLFGPLPPPGNEIQFLFKDIDEKRNDARSTHLREHFSVLDPGVTVTYEQPLTEDTSTTHTVSLSEGYTVEDGFRTYDFDPATHQGPIFSLQEQYVGSPYRDRVYVLDQDGSTIHQVKKTNTTIVEDKSGNMASMYMATDIDRDSVPWRDRNNYGNTATSFRTVFSHKVGPFVCPSGEQQTDVFVTVYADPAVPETEDDEVLEADSGNWVGEEPHEEDADESVPATSGGTGSGAGRASGRRRRIRQKFTRMVQRGVGRL